MNILIYVMTMLMLLTLLTYSRIESYRSFAVMESQFVNYMENEERSFTNFNAKIRYDEIIIKKQKSPKKDFAPGSGRLNLYPLFQSDRDNGDAKRLTMDLTKKMIIQLYQKQPFYIALVKERPNFVEEILRDITANYDPDTTIKDTKELSNIHIKNDPVLDLALYEILNGFPIASSYTLDNTNEKFSNDTDDSTDDDDEVINETYEAHADLGTSSIYDYVTFKKNGKTRIYLASRPLLQAIYDDPTTVEQIIDARNVIYKRLKSNPKERDELSLKFEEQFKRGHAVQYDLLLDFKVSGTNPKLYE